jgi:magnesium-transporting ATPase (P-type)
LSSVEAERRLARDGPNALPKPRQKSVLARFAGQFTHLLAVLLWVAAGLAIVAGQPPLALAIVIVIVLNAIFAFAQEYRADRSAERLTDLLPRNSRVRRDGRAQTIDASFLVVGDVVLLASGDRISADMIVTSAHALAVDESMVTGESQPVPRSAGDPVLAGTFVVQGEGTATVSTTGGATAIAGIAALGDTAARPTSPLTRQLNRVVRVVAVIAVVTGTALGLAGLRLGLQPVDAFLFAVGVAVALVPEGLLPTVTLSLARGASLMADRHALVRRLDAVETLGATTFICTDKTGTLTQNRMSVVEVWTPAGSARIVGDGLSPVATVTASAAVTEAMAAAALSAAGCVKGRAVQTKDGWAADGDPMEAALHAWALRLGVDVDLGGVVQRRLPYTADRMLSSIVVDGISHVLGAPESVLARCGRRPPDDVLTDLTARGRRVIAVARGTWRDTDPPDTAETDLQLLALVGLEDPPRPDVAEAMTACRGAGIKVAMITGDHLGTATAVAREVGLLGPLGVTVNADSLPTDDDELAYLLDGDDGAVIARVQPADKLRIARVMRRRGHVIAMTGDGVNDAPALKEADVGVAMGRSGSDVTREAADLVLLDDHFATIVKAIELGRSTFANVRRFLTYHLTDNVAELAPFAAWALTGGQFPLAIGVLQVLALDIGTDILPALALGAEPPSPRTLRGPSQVRRLVDAGLLRRAFLVLGPTEAISALFAFTIVLVLSGWTWGTIPGPNLLAVASGTAFATIAVAQMANAFACRSETVPVVSMDLGTNRLILLAVAAELVLLAGFVGLPWLARVLGGSWPTPLGWAMAFAAGGALLVVDGVHKHLNRRRRAGRFRPDTSLRMRP